MIACVGGSFLYCLLQYCMTRSKKNQANDGIVQIGLASSNTMDGSNVNIELAERL